MPLAPAESVIRNWLAAHFGSGYRVVTELPADLADVVAVTPVIQVTRFGGSDDGSYVLDAANVDIDVYALAENSVGGPSARSAGLDLSERVRTALRLNMPGAVQDGAFFATVATINAPHWVPYDNTSNLRRFVASYRITIRSVPIEGVLA